MSDICIEKLTSNINDELKKIDYWMGKKQAIHKLHKNQIYVYLQQKV